MHTGIKIFKELKAKLSSTKGDLEIAWCDAICKANKRKDKNRIKVLMKIKGIIRKIHKQEQIDSILEKEFGKKKAAEIIAKRNKPKQKEKDSYGIKTPPKPVENIEDIKEDIMNRVSEILVKEMYEGEDKTKKAFEEEMRIYEEKQKAKHKWGFYHGQLRRYEVEKKKGLKTIKKGNEKIKKDNQNMIKKWVSQCIKKETELKKEKEDWDKQVEEQKKKLESNKRQIRKKYDKDFKLWGKKTSWYKKLFWMKQPKIENYLNNKNSTTELFFFKVEEDETPKYKKWYKKALKGNKPRPFIGDFKPGVKENHEKKIESLEKEVESLKNTKPKSLELIPLVYKKKPPIKPSVEEVFENIEPPKEKRYSRVGINEIVAVIKPSKESLVTIDCPACKEKTTVRVYSETELKKGQDEICDNCKKQIIVTSTNIF